MIKQWWTIAIVFSVLILVNELEGFKGVLDWRSAPTSRRKRQIVINGGDVSNARNNPWETLLNGQQGNNGNPFETILGNLFRPTNGNDGTLNIAGIPIRYGQGGIQIGEAGGPKQPTTPSTIIAPNNPNKDVNPNGGGRPVRRPGPPPGHRGPPEHFGGGPPPGHRGPPEHFGGGPGPWDGPGGPGVNKQCQRNPNHPHCRTSNLPVGLESITWANRIKDNSVDIPRDTIGNPQRRVAFLGFGYPNYAYQQCITPASLQGRCRFVQHCALPEIVSTWQQFLAHACPIGDEYVGVCCPTGGSQPIPNQTKPPPPPPPPVTSAPVIESTPKPPPTPAPPKDTEQPITGCGIHTKADIRIVGGQAAKKDEWPWMGALLRDKTDQYCGATLITDQHVLTASHCVDGFLPSNITVRLGEYDFTNIDGGEKDFQVEKIIMHEDYDRKTYKNDIAVLKLKETTQFTSSIYPICLPPQKIDLEGKGCYVAGWGTTSYSGVSSNVLLEVILPVWNNDECKKAYTQPINTDVQLCAGHKAGNKDSCQGDSGGPLMYLMDSGRWATVGVVSYGFRCAEPGKPGVYTRVSSYVPWVQKSVLNS